MMCCQLCGRPAPELATVVPDSYSSAAMDVVLSLRAACVAAPMYFPDSEIEKTAASLASEGLNRGTIFGSTVSDPKLLR